MTDSRKENGVRFITVSVCAALGAVGFIYSGINEYDFQVPETLHIGTASPGGAYFKIGLGLKKILERELKVTRVIVLPTQGSEDNLERLEKKEVDFALSQSDLRRKDYKNVKRVASLYREALQIVVRKDRFNKTESIRDLSGKLVAVGPEGSGTRLLVTKLLNRYNVDYRDANKSSDPPLTSTALSQQALERGEIDALCIVSGIPDEMIGELLKKPNMSLLPILPNLESRFENEGFFRYDNPFYLPQTIPARIYGEHPGHPIPTIAVTALLVSHGDLGKGLVREVTRLLFRHKADLYEFHPAAQFIDDQAQNEENRILEFSFDPHPGAVAHYQKEPQPLVTRNKLVLTMGIASMFFGLAVLVMGKEPFKKLLGNKKKRATPQGSNGKSHDVFISYSTRNKRSVQFVEGICESLEQRGFTCWFAPRNIGTGAEWAGSIPEAIERTRRAFILVFTQEANESGHVARELALASSVDLQIVPFFLDDVDPKGAVRYHTSNVQRLRACALSREECMDRLYEAVRDSTRKNPKRNSLLRYVQSG